MFLANRAENNTVSFKTGYTFRFAQTERINRKKVQIIAQKTSYNQNNYSIFPLLNLPASQGTKVV
jgi:hypothetical protein